MQSLRREYYPKTDQWPKSFRENLNANIWQIHYFSNILDGIICLQARPPAYSHPHRLGMDSAPVPTVSQSFLPTCLWLRWKLRQWLCTVGSQESGHEIPLSTQAGRVIFCLSVPDNSLEEKLYSKRKAPSLSSLSLYSKFCVNFKHVFQLLWNSFLEKLVL